MLSWRWGGAVLSLAVVASVALLWNDASGHDAVDAAPTSEGAGLVLVGFVEAPDFVLDRFEARCTAMRFESEPRVHRAEIDPSGRFEIGELEDVDYCVEIVLRSNPSLVVARAEFVRPGGAELLLRYDSSQLFGAAGSADESR